jgi:cytochrome c-type biogenesis protein CcsB
MTDQSLAGYANYSLVSAMAVLTLAMLGYAVYLARLVPARSAAGDREAATEPAPEPATVGAPPVSPAPPPRAEGAVPARRTGARAAGVAGSLTWLAGLLLVGSVALRGASVHRWPLGNMFEFAVFAGMAVVLLYAGWSTRRDLRWLGLFVVAPVLLVLGLALTVWYTEASELMPSLRSYWLVIHVTVATIAVAVFTLGAAVGGLYLWQERLEARGQRSFMNNVPPAASLERLGYGLHIIAFPLWSFTLIAGAIWARQAWGSYWNWDPKEVWTFVIWVVYAAYLHARATSGWSRRSANLIALAGYGCILVNYGVVNVFFVGQHSYSGL